MPLSPSTPTNAMILREDPNGTMPTVLYGTPQQNPSPLFGNDTEPAKSPGSESSFSGHKIDARQKINFE